MTLDWYWYCTSPIMGLWETITWRDPKELRSNHVPRGILTGKSASSKGDGLESSANGLVNPGGAGGSLLSMRANSPGWAVFTGSEAGWSSGASMSVGSSSLGSDFSSGDKALSIGTEGGMGSFCATSSMVRSNRLPFLSRRARHLWSSPTALHGTLGVFLIRWHTFEEPGLVPLFLLIPPFRHPRCPGIQSKGGSPCILMHPGRVEWSTSHSFLVGWMVAWRLQLASRLVLWLGCHWGTSIWVANGAEFPPPVGYLSTLLNIVPDPVASDVLVGLNPSPGFLCFPERAVPWFWSRNWRSRATQNIPLLGGFLRLGGFQTFLEGCSSLWGLQWLKFLPQEGSFLLQDGEVQSSLPVAAGVRLPQYHPHWDSLKGPCISGVSMPHCRGLWSAPQMTLHSTAALRLMPEFSPVSQSRSPWCQRHECGAGNHKDAAHRNRVEHHINLRPPAWQGAAWRPQPTIKRSQGLGAIEVFPYVYLMKVLSTVNILMVLISFHQWGLDPTLFISAWIHLWGWFNGSGIPLCHD